MILLSFLFFIFFAFGKRLRKGLCFKNALYVSLQQPLLGPYQPLLRPFQSPLRSFTLPFPFSSKTLPASLLPGFSNSHQNLYHKRRQHATGKKDKGSRKILVNKWTFLDASSHLYKRVRPSVGPSFRNAFFLIEEMKVSHVWHQGGLVTSQKCRIASLHLYRKVCLLVCTSILELS